MKSLEYYARDRPHIYLFTKQNKLGMAWKNGPPAHDSSDEQVPIFHLSIPLAKIACSTKLADGMELHGPNAILCCAKCFGGPLEKGP